MHLMSMYLVNSFTFFRFDSDCLLFKIFSNVATQSIISTIHLRAILNRKQCIIALWFNKNMKNKSNQKLQKVEKLFIPIWNGRKPSQPKACASKCIIINFKFIWNRWSILPNDRFCDRSNEFTARLFQLIKWNESSWLRIVKKLPNKLRSL